jgi:hypothetical protein
MEERALICKTEKRVARHLDGRLKDSITGIDQAYTLYEHSSGRRYAAGKNHTMEDT